VDFYLINNKLINSGLKKIFSSLGETKGRTLEPWTTWDIPFLLFGGATGTLGPSLLGRPPKTEFSSQVLIFCSEEGRFRLGEQERREKEGVVKEGKVEGYGYGANFFFLIKRCLFKDVLRT